MLLYVCGASTKFGSLGHPCGRAADALKDGGHAFDVKVVGGFKSLPFSRRGRRDEVIALTGSQDVPVLVVSPDEYVAGTKQIVAWAKANPALTAG